jgi:hypothetical protein
MNGLFARLYFDEDESARLAIQFFSLPDACAFHMSTH